MVWFSFRHDFPFSVLMVIQEHVGPTHDVLIVLAVV